MFGPIALARAGSLVFQLRRPLIFVKIELGREGTREEGELEQWNCCELRKMPPEKGQIEERKIDILPRMGGWSSEERRVVPGFPGLDRRLLPTPTLLLCDGPHLSKRGSNDLPNALLSSCVVACVSI